VREGERGREGEGERGEEERGRGREGERERMHKSKANKDRHARALLSLLPARRTFWETGVSTEVGRILLPGSPGV
jgi:hypothetical protein